MAQNFYQTGGSYYTADTHQKILTPADLQKKAQAGGKEVPYTTFQQPAGQAIPHPDQIPNYNVTGRVGGTLYGTPKIDSNTLSVGSQTGNLSNQLPDVSATQSAIDIYSNQALSDGTQSLTQLQQQLAQLNAQSLQGNQAEQGRIQGQLDQTYARRDQDIADYRSMTDPLFKQGVDEYKRMTDALGQIDYSALINQRLGLTNDIVEYSKLMRADLDAEAGRPAVASVYYGRQAAIQQNYLSKISTAQAALQAIDGNFNLAQDIMNNGARMIQNISQDRLQFLNFVEGLYGQDIAIGETKLLNLKQEEKEQINELKNKLQSDIQRIEENKAIIQNLLADPATAVVASKAGLTLTDTMDEVAEKLNRFYVANPQYLPENVAAVRQLMNQFPDAGIQPTDTIQQAQAKLQNSATYRNSVSSGFQLTGDGMIFNPQTGVLSEPGGSVVIPQSSRIAYVHNNPGNLMFVGQAGATQGEAKKGGGYWAKFDTPEAGYQALLGQIRLDASRGLSLGQFINKYAPSSENNTNQYLQQIIQATGANANTPISQIDVDILGRAIAKKESGTTFRSVATDNNSVEGWVKLIQEGKANIESISDKNLRNKVVEALANSGPDIASDFVVQEKLQLAQNLIDHKGLDPAVGFGLGRWSIPGFNWGAKQEFIAGVEKLVSGLSLEALIQAKSRGATFGALSDTEMRILASSATKIGSWKVTDKNGKVTGYKANHQSMKDELRNIYKIINSANSDGSFSDPLGLGLGFSLPF